MRYYNEAINLYAGKKTDLAIDKMKKAVRSDTTWDEPYGRLGQWYFEAHRFNEAADLYSTASLYCLKGGVQFGKALTKSLLHNGQPGRALMIINAYESPNESGEWAKLKKQAYFIQDAMINQWFVTPVSIGAKINTNVPELFPSISNDTGLIYFTRRENNMNEELYRAILEDTCSEWKSVENLGPPLNSPDQESAQYISPDDHYMFFTRCDTRSENGWANGGCDLYMAYRVNKDTEWTVPQAFGATINTPYYEGMPSLSADNRELFFVSDRPGGYGGLDIWISRFENGTWQPPVNAGPNINTSGNETAPFIAIDNQTLYFSSDGLPGLGGIDLFLSRKQNDTAWGPAKNLGFPINTACNEMSACISKDSKILYFASDRHGPAENYDIYITALPEPLRPVPVKYLEGYVYDSLTSERLNYAQIYITKERTGDTLYQFMSNRGDASFMITLPAGATYIRHIGRIGYTEVEDTIVLDKQNLKEHVVRNIPMLPFDYKEIVPINDSLIATIHFDPNRVDLSPEEIKMLHEAIAPWMEDKGIIYYINAYTDNTGTPLINEELSFKRANLVTKELVSLGINEVQTVTKGWGEAKMIAPNDTEDGRKKNRRVEIIIKR